MGQVPAVQAVAVIVVGLLYQFVSFPHVDSDLRIRHGFVPFIEKPRGIGNLFLIPYKFSKIPEFRAVKADGE